MKIPTPVIKKSSQPADKPKGESTSTEVIGWHRKFFDVIFSNEKVRANVELTKEIVRLIG